MRGLVGLLVGLRLGVIGETNEISEALYVRDLLSGKLSRVKYLRLYPSGHSIRVYFTVHKGTVYLLMLTPRKSRTNLNKAEQKKLRTRMKWVEGN